MATASERRTRDFAEGIGSLHKGRSARQPYMYDVSEDGTASSADYLVTPNSSEKAGTSHGHRSRREKELRGCRREFKKYQGEQKADRETSSNHIKELRTQLFHCRKEAKKYKEAEADYRMIVAENDPQKDEDAAILDLKCSFAEVLVSQERFEEAELISRAVWEKRRLTPESEDFKRSHRQLCSILISLKKYGEAENMHRTMYTKEPKDSWALENGDAVCQTIAEQGQYDQAQLMQKSVWETRQAYDGERHDLTIRSGLQRIALLEMLVNSNNETGVSDAEKRLSSHRKKGFEWEMEVMLGRIWKIRDHPEPIPGILDAGHKLGNILFRESRFAESEAVLLEVWEGRKRKFGEIDVNAMATGSTLGKALLHQQKPDSYSRAATICHGIWHARQAVLKRGDIETISSGEDLAQAYLALEDWPEAESTYKWVVEQKVRKYGWPAPQVVDACWNLGQTLFHQGGNKHRKAEEHLHEVFQRWNQVSPRAKETLRCGHMLVKLLQPQAEKANDALQLSRDMFGRREASMERDVDYLDSGRLYGCLLLEGGNFLEAEKVLESLWGHETRGPDEEKMRSKCGYLYGQVLSKQQKCPEAKEVLEKIVASQSALFPAGAPELDGTSQLLRDVSDRCKEAEKERERNKKRRRGRWG